MGLHGAAVVDVTFSGGRLDGETRSVPHLGPFIEHVLEFRKPLSWDLTARPLMVSEKYQVTGAYGVYLASYVGLTRVGELPRRFNPARLPA